MGVLLIPIYNVDSSQYDYLVYQWSAEDANKYRENILKGKGCGIVSATNIAACLYAEISLQDYADSLVATIEDLGNALDKAIEHCEPKECASQAEEGIETKSKDTAKPSLKSIRITKKQINKVKNKDIKTHMILKRVLLVKRVSEYDMGYDTKTGEIFLWNKAGTDKIPTGHYHIR